MTFNNMDSSLIPYIVLLITIFVCWLAPIQMGVAAVICTVIAGLIFGTLAPMGMLWTFALGFSLWLGTRLSIAPLRWLSITVFLGLAVALSNHMLPGFNNLLVFDKIQLTYDSVPYTMYFNFDKTLVGVFIYLFFLKATIEKGYQKGSLDLTMKTLGLLLVLIIPMAFVANYVKFDPKFPPEFWFWFLNNLFFVCLAEEALFRGFIQGSLSRIMPYSKFPIAFAAILFGLAHYRGGISYILLATIAGFFYGYIYWRTKKIEFSMLAHVGLNTAHFLLFSYPALLQT